MSYKTSSALEGKKKKKKKKKKKIEKVEEIPSRHLALFEWVGPGSFDRKTFPLTETK